MPDGPCIAHRLPCRSIYPVGLDLPTRGCITGRHQTSAQVMLRPPPVTRPQG
ncbi:hypothetical protein I546_4277 [Mycobacterium kansasii 732]|nr:hypothetical protein I546_4277 [Mycobacterium kansasii 732]